MPSITGLSHLSLSVTDRDASVRWYGDVLGFSPFYVKDDDRFLETICIHAEARAIIGIVQHRDATGPFEHRRSGLDHLAFGVADRDALAGWHARLTDLGVTCSPVAETPFGPVLCFRDPDDIQLEFFVLEFADSTAPAERVAPPV